MWGLFNPNENNSTRFGLIDQINSEDAVLAIGNLIIYDERDVIAPIFYNDNVFNILPDNKVIATELPYAIAPPA
jgi:hypothetical protein